MNRFMAMQTVVLSGLIQLMILVSASARGDSFRTDEALHARFLEVRDAIGMQGELNKIEREQVLKTDCGTPIREGIKLESNDFKLLIDPVDGRILSLQPEHDYSMDHEPRMSLEQAEATAASILAKLGISIGRDMPVKSRDYREDTDTWAFTWEQQINGYPFPEAVQYILIGDQDGRLRYYKDTTIDYECPVQPVMEEAQAREAAKSCMESWIPVLWGNDYAVAGMATGNLQVVYPNRHYSVLEGPFDATMESAEVVPCRVYSYDFTFRYTGTNALSIAVPPTRIWVDASRGNVVGGL